MNLYFNLKNLYALYGLTLKTYGLNNKKQQL